MSIADLEPALPPATLRLRVDGAAIAANWHALNAMSGGARAGAAVKADGYGLGIDNVIPPLKAAGARDFLVAHWSEVPDLLQHVEAGQISVLHGVINEAEAAFARETDVAPVINSPQQAAIWTQTGGGKCHLMVDTGINRLGVTMDELGSEEIAALNVDILMSHLASADEDVAQNAAQLDLFKQAIAIRPAVTHSLSNSAGIALGTDYAFDLTRPGLSLYGGIPRPELAGKIGQVAFPEAAILQVRDLNAGDMVGYNAEFTADRSMRVATVSIGYADGFLCSRGNAAALQYMDEKLPILGRVSMDMVVVDISANTALKAGDFLGVPFDLPQISKACALSQYELLTTIGNRFGSIGQKLRHCHAYAAGAK